MAARARTTPSKTESATETSAVSTPQAKARKAKVNEEPPAHPRQTQSRPQRQEAAKPSVPAIKSRESGKPSKSTTESAQSASLKTDVKPVKAVASVKKATTKPAAPVGKATKAPAAKTTAKAATSNKLAMSSVRAKEASRPTVVKVTKEAAPSKPASVPTESNEPGSAFRMWKDGTRRGIVYVEGKENVERLLTVVGRRQADAVPPKKRGDKRDAELLDGTMAVYSDRRGRPFAWQIPFEIAWWEQVSAAMMGAH
jgi:hypothetical protein